jgi:hypothetical protein
MTRGLVIDLNCAKSLMIPTLLRINEGKAVLNSRGCGGTEAKFLPTPPSKILEEA